MTWAPQEVQKTLVSILSGDAQLQTLIGGTLADKRVYDFVPQAKTYPYITVEVGPMTDRGNTTNEGWSGEPQINIWYREPGRGRKRVQEIQARVDALIHNVDNCFEGWNVIVCRRTLVDTILEPDGITYHGVQRFRLFLGEA